VDSMARRPAKRGKGMSERWYCVECGWCAFSVALGLPLADLHIEKTGHSLVRMADRGNPAA
jgi:hypothetical protein